MPTYGYKCKSCGNTFEVVQSVNDEPIKECPECSGEVSKIFYPVGIAFKGSGFHVNDYKSNKRLTAEKKATDSDSASSVKASGNGDSGCSACAKSETCTKDK